MGQPSVCWGSLGGWVEERELTRTQEVALKDRPADCTRQRQMLTDVQGHARQRMVREARRLAPNKQDNGSSCLKSHCEAN